MASPDQHLSRDSLIQDGLHGKSRAIAAYDEMLWKIRAGFISVLYGTFTLAISLGTKEGWELPIGKAALLAALLVTGFTACALILDFHILKSKYRVVQAKEELVDLALWLSSGEELAAWSRTSLETLLHNSGEGTDQVSWKDRPSVLPIILIYVCSWILLCIALFVFSL